MATLYLSKEAKEKINATAQLNKTGVTRLIEILLDIDRPDDKRMLNTDRSSIVWFPSYIIDELKRRAEEYGISQSRVLEQLVNFERKKDLKIDVLMEYDVSDLDVGQCVFLDISERRVAKCREVDCKLNLLRREGRAFTTWVNKLQSGICYYRVCRTA